MNTGLGLSGRERPLLASLPSAFSVVLAGALSVFGQQDVPVAWQLLNDGDPPPDKFNPTIVYDSSRGRAVQLRSTDSWPGLVWELVGEDWVRRDVGAPLIALPCTAFDPDRGRVILFGGYDAPGSGAPPTNRTWEYDGDTWVEKQTVTRPPGRESCALVYDAARRRMVLFGGYEGLFYGLSDTWEYDGVDWTPIATRDSPLGRGQASMTFDAIRGVTVLFGGRSGGSYYGDTWTYDGRNWKRKIPATSPTGRFAGGFVYSPERGRSVLFGGVTNSGASGATWEWDGTNWIQLFPAESPGVRGCKLVYDTARGKVLLHGGQPDDVGYNDTWVLDGTTWTRIAVSGLPQIRDVHVLAYDPSRDITVLYGGFGLDPDNDTTSFLNDTWHFSNGSWLKQPPEAGAPTARLYFDLAFDASLNGLFGFGGKEPLVAYVGDEHRYTGDPLSWSSVGRFPPPARFRHGWVSAPPLGGMVMFGGNACCIEGSSVGYLADDTWIYSDGAWTELSPASHPSPRVAPGLAFHAATGKVVLYGGDDGAAGPYPDTWLFDGAAWTLHQATSPPGIRNEHALAYDESRQRVVLYGGGPTGKEGVTWEFDGSIWIARSTPFQPEPGRRQSPLAYDSKREVVLLFGGELGYYYNDTWAYGADPDEDGIVGKLDNCVSVANADQANTDGDAAGDVCDCAAADPTAYAVPLPVTGLTLSGGGATSLNWIDQSSAVGSGVRYDAASGALSTLRAGSIANAECLASQTAVTSASDSRTPAADDGYWYLVRARNVCGIGTYGVAALDAASPCP